MSAPPISVPGIAMRLPIGVDGGVSINSPIGDSFSQPVASPALDPHRIQEPSAFQTLFAETISKTNSSLKEAESAAKDFASGKSDDIHGTMIAASQADIQLRLVGSLRNRVVDAFNEIWRMQV